MARYDGLFDRPFPFSMGWHQAPVRRRAGRPLAAARALLPAAAGREVRKFMVGYELLSEAQRDITAEDAAERLREAASAPIVETTRA